MFTPYALNFLLQSGERIPYVHMGVGLVEMVVDGCAIGRVALIVSRDQSNRPGPLNIGAEVGSNGRRKCSDARFGVRPKVFGLGQTSL